MSIAGKLHTMAHSLSHYVDELTMLRRNLGVWAAMLRMTGLVKMTTLMRWEATMQTHLPVREQERAGSDSLQLMFQRCVGSQATF